ncbi:MAG: hypothetical protein HY892_03110 [Deltaproteobacteria bacterium]|nr:hypothetical protein [Deltaproteobacteria bacterium]
MRDFHRRKKGMREGSIPWWLCALLAIGFVAGMALDAAAYTRPTGEPPTDADLTLIGGKSQTVVVRLLNLTPYKIVQDPSGITAVGSTDKDRNAHKSFLFVPLGWPSVMSGLQGTWSQAETNGPWAFTPSNTNTATHPYNFVVAWDDQGGYVADSSMGWTIQGVYATALGPGSATKDVPLRLWFTRVKPTTTLRSELFGVVSAAIVEVVDLIGVALEPENPIAWVDAFVATKELASSSFEYANSEDTGGEKMYVAAYAVPQGTSKNPDCTGCNPAVITYSTSGETTDGVDVQWSTATGSYSANVVVTTQVLRGLDVDGYAFNGSVPIMNVVLWTPEEYAYGEAAGTASPLREHPAGSRINAILARRDLSRFTQFAHLFRSFNPSQTRTYHEALQKLRQRVPLTEQQQVLLEKMAAALEKGQTKLSPANR